jgi:hypothetical protein
MDQADLLGDLIVNSSLTLVSIVSLSSFCSLNPLSIGDGAVFRSGTRLLSGSSAEKHSILLEHTLVMTGECVDAGTVWQGWPSKKQVHVLLHRGEIDCTLYDSVKLRGTSGKSSRGLEASCAAIDMLSSSSPTGDIDIEMGIDGADNNEDGHFADINPLPASRSHSSHANSRPPSPGSNVNISGNASGNASVSFNINVNTSSHTQDSTSAAPTSHVLSV